MGTSDRDKTICNLYSQNDDISMGDLADQFNLSRQRIQQILKENNVDRSDKSYSNKYSEHDIEQALIEYFLENSEVPTSTQWANKNCKPSLSTIYDHFGSWTNALHKTGLPNDENRSNQYSRDELINILDTIYSRCNGQLTQLDYQSIANENDLPHYQTYIDRFGSWNEAIKAVITE